MPGGAGHSTASRPARWSSKSQREAARAYLLPDCPVAHRTPPTPPAQAPAAAAPAILPLVIGAVAPLAADFVVRGVARYVQRQQMDLTATYLAAGVGELTAADGRPRRCLVVVRGRFGPPGTGLPASSGHLELGDLGPLGLAAYPDLYMEAILERGAEPAPRAPDGVLLVVRPHVLQFQNSAARDRGDGEKSIGMVVVLRSDPLARSADEAAARQGATAVLSFDFGRRREGIALPAQGQAGAANAGAVQHPLFDLARAVRVGAATAPLNVYAFVTEAGTPDAVLALLSETLGQADNQAALEKALADLLTRALDRGAAQRN